MKNKDWKEGLCYVIAIVLFIVLGICTYNNDFPIIVRDGKTGLKITTTKQYDRYLEGLDKGHDKEIKKQEQSRKDNVPKEYFKEKNSKNGDYKVYSVNLNDLYLTKKTSKYDDKKKIFEVKLLISNNRDRAVDIVKKDLAPIIDNEKVKDYSVEPSESIIKRYSNDMITIKFNSENDPEKVYIEYNDPNLEDSDSLITSIKVAIK